MYIANRASWTVLDRPPLRCLPCHPTLRHPAHVVPVSPRSPYHPRDPRRDRPRADPAATPCGGRARHPPL